MYAVELNIGYNTCTNKGFERRRYLDETMKRRKLEGFKKLKTQASIVNADMDINLFQRTILGIQKTTRFTFSLIIFFSIFSVTHFIHRIFP